MASGQSHVPPRLTLPERIVFAAKCCFLIPGVGLRVVWQALKTRDFSLKALKASFIKGVVQVSTKLSLRELRSFTQPSGSIIDHVCETEGFSHETTTLDAGQYGQAVLHFIDCAVHTPGNILLYLHGGGYIFPISAVQVGFAHAAAAKSKSNLVILEYTLAPKLKYPGQLAQAVAALRLLLDHHDASEIIVGGDSAGGNLTLAILAHLRQPHPLVQPISEGGPCQLRAAFCVSPRCANDSAAPSYNLNASKDIVNSDSMKLFTSNWEPANDEVWATPVAAGDDFWHYVHTKQLLLLAGTAEVYVDDIKRLAEMMGDKNQYGSKVELVLCAEEIHTQAVLDFGADNWDGVMLKVLFTWLLNLK
ncbi:hypothetical protein ASPZODRAFT_1124063 [Penicilliopsis zonata CBS 506.65]|uniref:Alpha/beta hydrolase fold-3 domain-containing protein n=1 Tax=Penicilliopsis zonata CBS 506.65 TaxID=1073090 RepID=A0A1L9SSV6_9EURO|nr:hypothetical protein ASPZODRAFT_1124063 [Penicilliopsis zonata CBS 506.65]OJJ50193.1 hypothetical protein ASPZODRAFT_1124063 [Penicilliopsis zonata CBS 506.65]